MSSPTWDGSRSRKRSSVAVKEIIGVVLAYAIKSVLENLSKNNHWPDKPDPIAPAAEEETADQPSNDL